MANAALAPDPYEKLLSVAAVVLFAAAVAAVARGMPEWRYVPRGVWLHLATVLVATALTPVMLVRRRGDARHRLLGTIWVAAMLLTAVISLFVRTSNPHGFSPIHILSIIVLVLAPMVWWSARQHDVVRHRRLVRGLVTGALLIAGFFTFPFQRLLGHWLFG